MDQYAAQQVCNSICMKLADFNEDDFTRICHFLYYYGSENELPKNYVYYTALQAKTDAMKSVATNNIGLDVVSKVHKYIGDNLDNNFAALVLSPQGWYNFKLLKTEPNEPYYFLCTETSQASITQGPQGQSFLPLAFHSPDDMFQPSALQTFTQFITKMLQLHIPNETGHDDIVLLGDQMTLQDGKEHCRLLNGHIFEPETMADVNFLSSISFTYDLPDIWVGIYATKETFPRSKSDWKYFSNPSKVMSEVINSLFVQDDGADFVGKFPKLHHNLQNKVPQFHLRS